MDSNYIRFIEEFILSFDNNTFNKMLLSKALESDTALKRVQIRLVEIKLKKIFSFLFEFPTKTITKNFSIDEAKEQLATLIPSQFKNAVLYTLQHDIRLSFNKKKKSKLDFSKPTFCTSVPTKHNEEKRRFIGIEDNLYLKELGVVSKSNQIAPSMQDKYKQINKYIETIDALFKKSDLIKKDKIKIVDMGSGKGYLTFSIYDYLNNQLKIETQVIGVELREELVNLCNNIAVKCNYEHLSFHNSNIENYPLQKADLLIALHACDTATDDAIFKGIMAQSSIIVTAPCCHKQIRKELNVENELAEIVKFGILKERMAEMATDTLRSLFLELHGYKTQIFEFIADAHTHKNVMITAVKGSHEVDKEKYSEKIKALKTLLGIKEFYLENLFKKKN